MINIPVYEVLTYPIYQSIPVSFNILNEARSFKIYKLTTNSHSVVKENGA